MPHVLLLYLPPQIPPFAKFELLCQGVKFGGADEAATGVSLCPKLVARLMLKVVASVHWSERGDFLGVRLLAVS